MPYVKVLLSILVVFSFAEAAVRLNDYIQHYETLDYDSEAVHQEHHRAKRSINDPFVFIPFHAHGRHFNLRLKRDTSVFSQNLLVDGPAGSIDNFDVSHIYSGTLWGEENTHAFGSIRDGVFDGKISTPKGNYYVERANKYFSPVHAANFHSVIYSETDMIDPHKDKHAGHAPGCGATDDVKRWMDDIQNSAAENPKKASLQNNETANNTARSDNEAAPNIRPTIGLHSLNPHHKYLKEAQSLNASDDVSNISGRVKRAVEMKKRACSLYIQTDPLLWEHIHNKENDEAKTREEIASLIAQHVKAVNLIYEPEDFGGYRGIKFLVQRITINDSKSCNPPNNWANPFCSPNIDVSNFLNLNSQMNHDAFCLAYVFTYRDFTGGTLGLAWVASPQGASGGICEKYKAYTENVGGRHVQTKRSLNTGIITFVNYNSRVPPKVSQLTLAHEIGHNFGSPHDYPPDCRPGGQDGNFIMFASATSGDRPNNSKFSFCSKRNITAVLEAVVGRKAGKENCFLEDDGPFCGNHIVEAGEECDCGYNAEECSEMCCYPFEIHPDDLKNDPKARHCTRKRLFQQKVVCSPSEGPCCNQNCSFASTKLCREDSDCNHEAKCNGRQAQCPTSDAKQNGTECNKNTQVCTSGECIGSICLKYGLEECFLVRERGVSPEQLCEVACQQRGKDLTCRSTFEQQDASGRNMSGIRLRPGSPCDNYQGYCDVFQKCRAVDAEGPLARLKNLLFNQKTLMTIAQWVTEMWWAVLLIGIAFIIVMAMFIKCCAVHTPSSNPKKPPALRITDTMRRPVQTLRRKRNRHHQTAPHSSSTGASSNQAPPPYVAPSRGRPAPSAPSAAGPGGPSRGYGEGRGHYNRPKGGWMPNDPYAAAYPNNRQYFEMTPRDGHV